jgi:hypothetical protein
MLRHACDFKLAGVEAKTALEEIDTSISVADSQRKIREWQEDYNAEGPHSSLEDIRPRSSRA